MDLEHENRLTKVEARAESNTHRINELEERQNTLESLATSVATLAERETRVEHDVKEIKVDVKSLTAKPGKRWESLEEKVLLTLAAAILGYILAMVGLSV